ncbi:Beta-glucosidase 1 [Elsinoe australis]|uniref:beta-glucosidase n=1 Tax=Elsinoe australis TaxID=40998 RepID=A0A2P7Z719_9PEZI|nr:Beta-glucosidase 1 [Elsinoe australis]
MGLNHCFAVAAAFSLVSALPASGSNASTSITAQGLINNGQVALGDWQSAYDQALAFAQSLNSTAKFSIATGGSAFSGSVNFTALQFKDGQQGVQEYYFVSGFSQAAALAMTWDKDAIYTQSRAVADEYYGEGFQVINGPTSEPLGRTPWGGRLGEAFTPDPYLNGIVFGRSVKGYTDAGVIAGGKHFLLNEQETNRTSSGMGDAGGMGGGAGGGAPPGQAGQANGTVPDGQPSGTGSVALGSTSVATSSSMPSSSNSSSGTISSDSAPYSSNADDKTIHETYLWPFFDGVKNGLGAVMCAMTEVNNTVSCENQSLLMDLLKTELGFPGLVYPDVNGQKAALGSIQGGLDYGSGSTWSTTTLLSLLSNGSLTEARLNDMVIRNTIAWFHQGLNNGSQPSLASSNEFRDVRKNHASLIRRNGADSIVLLKNVNNALPLQSPRVISIFGANAGPGMTGPNTAFSVQGAGPTYPGHLATGSGSGQASLPYAISPFEAINQRASASGSMVRYLLNDTYASTSSGGGLVMVDGAQTGVTPSFSAYASNSDVCMVFINALAGEGADRTELYNDDQDSMINTVASNCNNTIVMITTTGPRLLDQWIENDNITAVLYSAPLGQESGNSIADVLYGDINPSARLTYTIAKNESDYNIGICYTKQCNFTEGVYIDYRSFQRRNVTARYPFGHGLSYTSFDYTDLTAATTDVDLDTYASGLRSVGGREDLWDIVATVEVAIENTGSVAGADVPQLYVTYPELADQPRYQLRGFEKPVLEPGAKTTITFELRRRDLSYWDVGAQEWAIAKGTYGIMVGRSVSDPVLTGSLII